MLALRIAPVSGDRAAAPFVTFFVDEENDD